MKEHKILRILVVKLLKSDKYIKSY